MWQKLEWQQAEKPQLYERIMLQTSDDVPSMYLLIIETNYVQQDTCVIIMIILEILIYKITIGI